MKQGIQFGKFSPQESQFLEKHEAESQLVRSRNFQSTQEHLSMYVYAFLRILEFEAAWTISVPDCNFKIELGIKIGRDGYYLDMLNMRMSEKLRSGYIPNVNIEYAENFRRAHEYQDKKSIAAFLIAIDQDLLTNINSYCENPQAVADEPTLISLDIIKRGLGQSIEALASHAGTHTELEIAPLQLDTQERIAYTGTEELPRVPDFPGRSENLKFHEKSIVIHKSYADLMETTEKLKRFTHYVYMDIEIAAIEVCAKNIIAYRNMPLEFKLDMARQLWDEARHAILFRDFLEDLGGKEGDYTYNAKVWTKAEQSTDLAERLAIQQVFQEGNALESNLLLTDAFKDAGNEKMVEWMDFVNADEAVHVKIGNDWVNYLLQGSERTYEQVLTRAAEYCKSNLSSNVALNRTVRNLTGFPESFVDLLEHNNKINGYRKS